MYTIKRVQKTKMADEISRDMMTSSNGNIFRVTGHLCGEFTGPRWIPAQRPVTRSFDVFFDLHPNKRFSKQSRGWWFDTPLWSHGNDVEKLGFLSLWTTPSAFFWFHHN